MPFPNWASIAAAAATRRCVQEMRDDIRESREVPYSEVHAAELALSEHKLFHRKTNNEEEEPTLKLLDGYTRALAKFNIYKYTLYREVSKLYYGDLHKNPRQYPWLDDTVLKYSKRPRSADFEESGDRWVDMCRSKGYPEGVLEKVAEVAVEWAQGIQKKIQAREAKRKALIAEARDHSFLTRVFYRDYSSLLDAMRQDSERQHVDLDLKYAFQTSPRQDVDCPYPAMRVHYVKEPTPHGAVVVKRSDDIIEAIGIAWRRPHEHSDVVFYPDGRVYATPAGLRALPFLDALSTGVGADQLGKLFDHCMICGKPVSTEESLERAMGPVCTERYAALMTMMFGDLKRRNLNSSNACVVNAFLEPRGIDALAAAPEMAAVLSAAAADDNVLSNVLSDFGPAQGMQAIVAFLKQRFGGAEDAARVVAALDEACLAMAEHSIGDDGAYLPHRHPRLTMDILKWARPGTYEWLRKRWVRAALAADFDAAR